MKTDSDSLCLGLQKCNLQKTQSKPTKSTYFILLCDRKQLSIKAVSSPLKRKDEDPHNSSSQFITSTLHFLLISSSSLSRYCNKNILLIRSTEEKWDEPSVCALLSFVCFCYFNFSSCALFRLAEQPIRGISLSAWLHCWFNMLTLKMLWQILPLAWNTA